MKTIERFVKYLDENGLTVLKVSKEIGISPYTIYKWINKNDIPKADQSKQIEDWIDQKRQTESAKSSSVVEDSEVNYGADLTEFSRKYTQSLEERIKLLEKHLDLIENTLKANLDSVLQAQYAQLAHQKALAWYLAKQHSGLSEAALKEELQLINNKVAEYAGVVPQKGKKHS